MKDWKRILISPTTAIIDAIEIIDAVATGIVLVVDDDNRLQGTVTDGDVRRAILKGIRLDEPINLIMNAHPTVARINDDKETILTRMKLKDLKQIPILDDSGRVVSMEMINDLIRTDERGNWVLLMAGGMGKRLNPLTNDCPKPLLKVGDKPILETIIQNFVYHGFMRFYISVNYKAEMIEEYFGDGAQWGVEIRYLREKEPLGTAGALSLITEPPGEPLLVMNGDLLTKVNFGHLLDFHKQHRACATMCVREYKLQVPYGVVQMDKHRLKGIIEKPVQQFFVSAGVYVLDPVVLKHIPKSTLIDMPALFERLISKELETAVFPVREYWLDIGRIGDFERANGEFAEVFR
ncbi:nucleotidyltransferase family protein [Anaeroselena agilis]|uniref:Nucleotidyltransferase family protein n=1 Tax=Anaeroselena agilis TaxID=3063788 RepID=A0ABU3P477_9FIRM|nr:nucleotidyltransferase family protein [Selenomonadales bacterium 4137-cl]